MTPAEFYEEGASLLVSAANAAPTPAESDVFEELAAEVLSRARSWPTP